MRIAIYVRKSKWTGRGESIENQILMCREYIEKFIEDSREAEILVYSDEGFSGKDTNRPQFQKMLEDMKQGPFQYLVCYRLDRLGRNLADLALLIEKLNREHTEFVSIKEHFDTSTPMGKAMLYFSGVLAQMEREQIGERVISECVFDKQLAVLSFAAASGGYNSVSWIGSDVLDAVSRQGFTDGTIQAGKVSITQKVESRGYEDLGDWLFAQKDFPAEQLYYRMEFTMTLQN